MMTKTNKSTAMIRRRKNKMSPEFLNKARRNQPDRAYPHDSAVDDGGGQLFQREVLDFSVIQKIMSSDKTIFWGLLAIRLVNAMLMQTYFVPDEFWQSVEVAHKMVFNYGYLTWEWKTGIRSYSYPLLFATLYKILELIGLDNKLFLIRGPRLLQGVIAGVGDMHLFLLSRRLAGQDVAQWTLLCQVLSWFTGYCCTRTLSNCMETVLVTSALYYFPWPGIRQPAGYTRRFVMLAAWSVVVRPTAAVIWILLCSWHLQQCKRETLWSTLRLYITMGLAVLGVSMVIDYVWYGHWLLVHYNFLSFNVLSGGSAFYGRHPWYWYVVQGLPVTLGPHCLPFMLGAWRAKNKVLLMLLVWKVFVLSFLAHKEFRFLLPVLPLAMHYCGLYFHSVMHSQACVHGKTSSPSNVSSSLSKKPLLDKVIVKSGGSGPDDTNSLHASCQQSQKPCEQSLGRGDCVNAEKTEVDSLKNKSQDGALSAEEKVLSKENPVCNQLLGPGEKVERAVSASKAGKVRLMVLLLATSNVLPLLYFSLIHQRGTIDVMNYLHDTIQRASKVQGSGVFPDILFLMPCHSTPYYSYLHSNVSMRFLTCEPNLNQQKNYTDQADRFYQDPAAWLKTEYLSVGQKLPTHVVYFDSLQPSITDFLLLGSYRQCATFFHTHVPEGRVGSHVIVSCR